MEQAMIDLFCAGRKLHYVKNENKLHQSIILFLRECLQRLLKLVREMMMMMVV
jgi:hypothetical protein